MPSIVEARRDADDRLAERQFLHAELLDDHLDRKFGQDRARTAYRAAEASADGSGRRRNCMCPMVSRSTSSRRLNKRESVPDQPDLVDFEPRAVAVGKDDVADRGVGGQHPVDRADRDAGRLRRERPRQQVGEDALVRFVARACRAERDQARRSAPISPVWERAPHHQKACPMLT